MHRNVNYIQNKKSDWAPRFLKLATKYQYLLTNEKKGLKYLHSHLH